MFNFLKYFDGAQPGKKRKRTIEDEEKSNKKADYEKHRKERSFNEGWCVGRPWLSFEQANKSMHCKLCRSHYQNSNGEKSTFITGCTNFKTSAVVDHEKSRPHIKAQQVEESRQKSSTDKLGTKAGAALLSLKAADRSRLTILFRNAHAVAKYNRPLSDYHWLCKLDIAKGVQQLQIDSTTYLNDKAAVNFIHSIAKTELQVTKQIFDETHFLAFLMDGTTDISGSEQESIYLRGCLRGKVTERFLNISSPESTTAEDLYKHVITVFEKNEISTDKLVALGSDGASNMTGVRSGLATLLRDRINPELFNVHCLCHRLELAFRDVVKKQKLYDKLMTLLIGLHYFYKKSYNNKKGLLNAIAIVGKGVLMPKVTGTRWLPHLYRGINALLKTYKAFQIHLADASHKNPKAEGLYKIMTDMHLMAFIFFLHDVLDLAMRLSLKLQRNEATLSDSMFWVESTIELLLEKKGGKSDALIQLLESRSYCNIELRGSVPEMKYADGVIEGFVNSMKARFLTEAKNLVNATHILNFGEWSPDDLKEYGEEEIQLVFKHFERSLKRACPDISIENVLTEWSIVKKMVTKRYEKEFSSKSQDLTWAKVLKGTDIDHITMVIDVMLTIPSTSVKCETAFSQLKLLKTCRRSRLGPTALNSLMTVKLLSRDVDSYDPGPAIDTWNADSVMGRRPNYKRLSKKSKILVQDDPEVVEPDEEPEVVESDEELSNFKVTNDLNESELNTDVTVEINNETTNSSEESDSNDKIINEPMINQSSTVSAFDLQIEGLCEKDVDDEDDEDCYDYQDEFLNFEKIFEYSRN